MTEVFDLKTSFLLGNYQSAINHGRKIDTRDENVKLEKDIYVYRSYIEQKNYNVVLDGISDSDPYPLLAVRALALYLHRPNEKESVLNKLKEWLDDPEIGEDFMVQYIAALIYYNEDMLDEALQCLAENRLLEAYVS